MYVQSCVCLCVCTVHIPVTWSVSVGSIHGIVYIVHYHCRQFLFTCCKVGMNRPCATRRNAEVGFTIKYETHRGWLPERTHKKFFNKRKGNMSNPTRKVFSVQRHSRLCSPHQSGASFQNAGRLQHT